MQRRLSICALVAIGSWGCGDAAPEAGPCVEQLNGICVGVENEAGDKAGPCPCSGSVTEVNSHDALMAALGGAPGCIMLADGAYGVVELRDGFEIIGASAGVTLQWLNFVDGSASACRMKTIGAWVATGASATMQYLGVGPSPEDGVRIEAGAAARIVGTTIEWSERYGVSAIGVRSLAIERSLIAVPRTYGRPWKQGGPGIWVSCPEGCTCGAPPEVLLRDTVVRDRGVVGVSIVGAHGDLRNVSITRTYVGDNFEHGLGIAVSQCSSITATQLDIVDNADAGMCVDGSKVELADVQVTGNLRGIFVHSASAPAEVRIAGATIAGNPGIGLAITGGTFAVVDDSIVQDTPVVALPGLVEGVSAGAIPIGDGICWNGGAVAHMHRVTVRRCERHAILIHGPASGILEDISVHDGVILQGNYEGGSQPMTSGTTPPIETSTTDSWCAEDAYPLPQ